MDGLVYYSFHFVEKKSWTGSAEWVVRMEGEFFAIPMVFPLEGSIEKNANYQNPIYNWFAWKKEKLFIQNTICNSCRFLDPCP